MLMLKGNVTERDEELEEAGVRLGDGLAHRGRDDDVGARRAEDREEERVAPAHPHRPGEEDADRAVEKRRSDAEEDELGPTLSRVFARRAASIPVSRRKKRTIPLKIPTVNGSRP